MSLQFTRVLSTKQLRVLEAEWIRCAHESWGLVLMEVAGLTAAQVASSMRAADDYAGVAVVCGGGNNGGDGFVVARHLQRWRIMTQVFVIGKPPKAGSEADVNMRILESIGCEIEYVTEETLEHFQSALRRSSLIVDAIFGTGIDRKVEGLYADAIDIINFSHIQVLSIDVPSGINSDTGAVMGTAIEADATVTFGHLKAGLLHHPGADHAGDIILADIGLPEPKSGTADDTEWYLATYPQIAQWLPSRGADVNKGSLGRLLCIAGSNRMAGAGMLASRASLRTGVGVTVFASTKSALSVAPPEEIVYQELPETETGSISSAAMEQIKSDRDRASAYVIGPGLTTHNETVKFVHQFVAVLEKPTVIDADALNAIADASAIKFANGSEIVMTPHPKEMSRLLGITVAEVQADRIAAAEKGRDKYGCTVVLKGAHTVVATVDGTTWIIPCGNPGMATAGAGDVLSGIIGALLAQGVPAQHAAVAGTYLHAAAGDLASATHGEDGMVASNIIEALPEVLAQIRSGEYTGTDLEEMLLSM